MPTLVHQRVAAARAGTNPTVICRVPSGWLVLGDVQFFRGYALLLADPVVADLNALNWTQRSQFLLDMTVLGDALLEVTDAYRINYEILGNAEPALHAHVFPRYLTEPEELRSSPVWNYDRDTRNSVKFDLARDKVLMTQLAAVVQKRIRCS
jgi:diadenosine tetraphosphate (Ap4A) HIT family hydrolase